MGKKRRPTTQASNDQDWVTALAKESSAATVQSCSKADRIEKRDAKKRRREDRKAELAPLPTKQQQTKVKPKGSDDRKRLKELAAQVFESSTAFNQQGYVKPYSAGDGDDKTKMKKRKWDEQAIQPRTRDYGGIGLARPSLLLPFEDPSFFPMLTQSFLEHIPGFFGKQKTKAMKKQLNSNMLWRQLADKKNSNQKVNGKKLSDMAVDERVEAMIQNGMVFK
jgi:hypothetical protein